MDRSRVNGDGRCQQCQRICWFGSCDACSDSYSLDSVASCMGGPGAFSVQATIKTGARLLQLGAFDGDVKSVRFRVGDSMAQVSDQTGIFDGKTFRFEGEAQVFTTNSINRMKLSVTAICDDG